jgi:hypothetical protein
MTPIPITFALMSTTKGHFDVKTRYRDTLDSFNRALPLSEYHSRIAHIKVSGNENAVAADMMTECERYGFKVWLTDGEWSHGSDTHHLGYLNDLLKVSNDVKTPYVLVVEDDWGLLVREGEFIEHLQRAISWLDEDPTLMQVRIPRFANEGDRIRNLMQKHGLYRWAFDVDQYHFRHDDFSANPSLYRTRDLRAAIILTLVSSLPKHIEHGLGMALKTLSYTNGSQFACFNPAKISISHQGTPIGQEDSITQPLIAT